MASQDDPETQRPATPPARFDDLPLHPQVREAIRSEGYETPTEVQSLLIPLVHDQRDVLAQSQTGTGKTAAFALPILSRLDLSRASPQALVLAPTRELAIQVAKSFATYGRSLSRFRVAAIYGGQDYDVQFRQLKRGAHVIVGTPGRTIDHIKRKTLSLQGVTTVVLDEADEMLNMGFLEEVEFVLDAVPVQRQIALFSATLPKPIRSIAKRYQNDPVRIVLRNKTATAESIRQRALFVPPHGKIEALTRLLEVEDTDGVIVFTRTRDATVTVADELSRRGRKAAALNGDMPQRARERTIEKLKTHALDILVATDVAARGLDVSRISHVFNFDAPHDTQAYIHRVGRTGRAGRNGEAIIFLTNAQREKLRTIERATRQPIEIVQVPTASEINIKRVEHFKQRITDTAGKDLSTFEELIGEYTEETGMPMVTIAAALAQLAQGDLPLLERDRPRNKVRTRDSRHTRGPSGPGRVLPSRGVRAAPARGMERFRIEVGLQDGVEPGNILGALAKKAGIDGSVIGPIKIHDEHSTIDLPEGMPKATFRALRRTWLAGKRINLSRSKSKRAGRRRAR